MIAVKPTLYKGYYFRSKNEAKWAVFFDKLGIPYQYEPEAFMCSDGSQYTPDFFLPNSYLRDIRWKGLYLEVKHKEWTHQEDIGYTYRISTALPDSHLVLLCGDPYDIVHCNGENNNEQLCPWWDNYMVLMYCGKCRVLKTDYDEGNYCNCPLCGGDIMSVSKEAEYARQYRFVYTN